MAEKPALHKHKVVNGIKIWRTSFAAKWI